MVSGLRLIPWFGLLGHFKDILMLTKENFYMIVSCTMLIMCLVMVVTDWLPIGEPIDSSAVCYMAIGFYCLCCYDNEKLKKQIYALRDKNFL